MNARHQIWFAWSIVPFIVIYILAWAWWAGFVPPHSPLMTTSELAQFYEQNRLGIRGGNLIGLVVSALLFTWPAAIAAQMARIETGRFPVYTLTQFVTGAVLGVFFMACNLLWTIAAFRPDLNPDTLRMLDDAAWLIFVMAYPEFTLQMVCIAVVCLADKRPQPFLPRWACYMTLWTGIAVTGGGFSTFFKTGPFAWNGVFGFWLPVAFFLSWALGVMLPFLLRAIKQQVAEEAAEKSNRSALGAHVSSPKLARVKK